MAGQPVLAVHDQQRVLAAVGIPEDVPLEQEGRVGRKDVGARAVAWWVEGADPERPAATVLEGDPLFGLPTAASGRGDVSGNVDEHLADAAAGDQ